MDAQETRIEGLKILTPRVFEDSRGYFFESFNARSFESAVSPGTKFVQDNESFSGRGVLRGLHYQVVQPQGKLVRVVAGEVFDVAVDLRRSSPTFGEWEGVMLSAENKRQFWVPVGFAHGFLVTSETAIVGYKTTDYYSPDGERAIAWNDPDLAIEWPAGVSPLVSDKDGAAGPFAAADCFE
jgi:dTDP-4-dehydrorhamnose 3,5-epimerase